MADEEMAENVDLDHDEDSANTARGMSASVHALRPVTLCQVLTATQPFSGNGVPWTIDGREVQTIHVVGCVIAEGVKRESRTAWYRLIDGTNGRAVTALRFTEDFDNVRVLPQQQGFVPKHVYVRIKGHLFADRGSRGGPTIRVDAFHVVTDPHEPHDHVLRAMYTQVCLEKGPPPPEVLQSLPSDNQIPAENPPTGNNTPVGSKSKAKYPVHLPSPRTPPVTPRNARPTTPPPTSGPSTTVPSTPTRRPATSDIEDEPAAKRPVPGPGPFSTTSVSASASTSTSGPASASARNPFPASPRTPRTPTKSSRFRPAQASPFTPSTEHRFRKLSTCDPLSDLTTLQRKILLKIMEATRANPDEGLSVTVLTRSLKNEEVASNSKDIEDALDYLMDNGHIVVDTEAMYYRAADPKGKRPVYEFVPDD